MIIFLSFLIIRGLQKKQIKSKFDPVYLILSTLCSGVDDIAHKRGVQDDFGNITSSSKGDSEQQRSQKESFPSRLVIVVLVGLLYVAEFHS